MAVIALRSLHVVAECRTRLTRMLRQHDVIHFAHRSVEDENFEKLSFRHVAVMLGDPGVRMKNALIIPAVLISTATAAYVLWPNSTTQLSETAPTTSPHAMAVVQPSNLSRTPNASLTAAATLSRAAELAEPIAAQTPKFVTKPESFDEWPDAVRDVISEEMGLDTLEEFDVKKKKGTLKFEAVGRLPNGMEVELRTDAEGNVLERDVDIDAREMPSNLMDAVTNEIDPTLGDVLVESVEKRERKDGLDHYEVRSKAGPWAFETQVDHQGRILDVKAKYRPVPVEPDADNASPQY